VPAHDRRSRPGTAETALQGGSRDHAGAPADPVPPVATGLGPEPRRPAAAGTTLLSVGAALLLVGCSGGAPAADAPAGAGPAVTFVGDSWTAGAGATDREGYAPLTADRLGWRSTVLGSGGSGYVRPGRHGPFGQRIEETVDSRPDVLVVQGSLNDGSVDAEQLDAAAHTTLLRFREGLGPAVEIVVLGAPHAPGTDPASIERINESIASAAADVDARFVDVAAENWTDPADGDIWADPFHPDDDGHAGIAERLASVLRDVVDD
jgi:lysophospholipase L1-like esterase